MYMLINNKIKCILSQINTLKILFMKNQKSISSLRYFLTLNHRYIKKHNSIFKNHEVNNIDKTNPQENRISFFNMKIKINFIKNLLKKQFIVFFNTF